MFFSNDMIDASKSFDKYLADNSKLFDTKIKGGQAIFVRTFPNFKKCFCIVLLIKVNKSLFIEFS